MPSANELSLLTPAPIGVQDLVEMEQNLDRVLTNAAQTFHQPDGQKSAPTYNATQLARLCRKSPSTMARLIGRAQEFGLPPGESAGSKKVFTHAEAWRWVRAHGTYYRRAQGVPGCTVAIGNFKGGVGKTVVTLSVAQALSLMGYNVLCIDMDPQGSLTALMGKAGALDLEETLLPIFLHPAQEHARSTVVESIQPTYWEGIDLIAATTILFNAEFSLPARQTRGDEPGFHFQEVLDRALSSIRHEYDYIIIDTPPSLSYVTMNAYQAADAILMPLPAEGLDLASSLEFWGLFTALAASADEYLGGEKKKFAWVGIVPSKVDNTKIYTRVNMQIMQAGYGSFMFPAEIPLSTAVGMGAMTLSTIYDMAGKYDGAKKTYDRVRDAFDKLALEVDYRTRHCKWQQSPPDIERDHAEGRNI